ncbi:MAG: hypothetical protein U5L04_02205 [Trueperaceae bacterium]|nr:hypothetical protein [Trueperaceae bacterium]
MSELTKKLTDGLEHLARLSQNDPALRKSLHGLARSVLAVTGDPAPPSPQPKTSPEPPPTPAPYTLPRRSADLAKTVAHCRLKARASRWLEHHGFTRDPLALRARNRIIDDGKSARCYLWTADRNIIDPNDQARHQQLAVHFEQLAEALELWSRYHHSPHAPDLAALIAEIQAALGSLYSDLRQRDGRAWSDPDRDTAYDLMRHYADETGTPLAALRSDARIDPGNYPERTDRLASLRPKLAGHG